MTKIINFFGGPGVGKSTLASGLFYHMKLNGISSEYVPEYAKELTYLKRFRELENQTHVFGEQLRRIMIPYNQVEYIITDSPIILGIFYVQDKHPNHKNQLTDLITKTFNLFNNKNILVESDYNRYDPFGRNQTKEESIHISNMISNWLNTNKLDYLLVNRNTPIIDIWNYIND